MQKKYPVLIFWADGEDHFVASVPDLPGCCAVGAAAKEATDELDHAIAAWVEAADKAGNPIPSPTEICGAGWPADGQS